MHNNTGTTTTSTGQVDKSSVSGFDRGEIEKVSTKLVKGLEGRNAIQVNMETSESFEGRGGGGGRGPVLNHKANAVFKLPVSDKWSIFGTSQIQLKTNHTTRIVIGLLALFVVTSLVLNGRVQTLADRNGALENQMGILEEQLKNVMDEVTRMSQEKTVSDRVKRSLEENRQFLPSVTMPVDVDEVQKARNGNETYGFGRSLRSNENEQEVQGQLLGVGTRKRGKYKASKRHARNYTNNKLEKLRERNEAKLAKLRMRLRIAKERASSKILQLQAKLSSLRYEPRAAYLTVRDPNINIENAKQHIGPWYIADSGRDIGFNDLWYQNLDLDENGTSVMFQESGLYLIYAQVYYITAPKTKKDETPLGFRIYLKKEISSTSMFQRPIPIAECVPSFPSTFYQTCFTQICWYVEKGDSVYLEHFTKAKPVISSEDMGQTFLGIVRLSQ